MFASTMNTINNEVAYKHFYAEKDLKKPYALALTAIIVAEVVHLLLLAGFMADYVHRHKDQMFRRTRRRRNPLDGEIYDYDPDYDEEGAQ